MFESISHMRSKSNICFRKRRCNSVQKICGIIRENA